jgi:hypothetical protein
MGLPNTDLGAVDAQTVVPKLFEKPMHFGANLSQIRPYLSLPQAQALRPQRNRGRLRFAILFNSPHDEGVHHEDRGSYSR